MVLTKRHFRVCAFSSSSASFKWKDKLHCSRRSRWKKKKRMKESFDCWQCQHCVLKPTWEPQRHDESSWNHRRLCFFVRHGGSIRRLIGISDFLSCDANAVVFHGWDSEKRTFRLKRKLGPNSDCLSDVSWYDYVYVMLCFWEIELYQRTFEFLSESHGSITNRQA